MIICFAEVESFQVDQIGISSIRNRAIIFNHARIDT